MAAEESPLQTTVRERLTAFLRGRDIKADIKAGADKGAKASELTVTVRFKLGRRAHEVRILEDDVQLDVDGKTVSFDGADYDDEQALARDLLKIIDREITANQSSL